MKKILFLAAILSASLFASAQDEVLKIELNDGSFQTIKVEDIKEMTFDVAEASVTEGYVGSFSGRMSVVVGGMFTYETDITLNITEGENSTLDVAIPQYQLENTVMGNLTLGEYTIKGLAYDEAKGAFYRLYGADGLSEYFKAESDGTVTMDKVYDFKESSEITITKTATGVNIVNSFQLGAMPFPIVATLDGAE